MIEIDSRNKKPKLWNLLILSIVAAVGLFFILRMGDTNTVMVREATGWICMYLVLALYLLGRAWLHQLEYNPYSYNTIYYSGFFLFALSVLATHLTILIRSLTVTGESGQVRMVLTTILGSARDYMVLSFPFLLVFSCALFISNVELIRHEGKRFVNILGMILAVLIIGGEAVLLVWDHMISVPGREPAPTDFWINIYAAFYLYFECMLIGAIIADTLAARFRPKYDKDFLIILGCKIQKDGRPTPLLRGRVDQALDFARRQKEETGKDLIFIPSGGLGPDEVISESESMRNYMVEQGIPAEQIIMEDKSKNTFENMLFSKEKVLAADPNGKVAFSTTNYHVFRSGLYARRVKMRAQGMGAPTKWYFWPNASVREFVGLLTEHRLKQALILVGLILFYIGMTVLLLRFG